MGKLVYSAISSLDGYVADREGGFGWAVPDDEVHRFVNELERPVATYLYGRRMYEVMAFWEDPRRVAEGPDFVRDFGEIWRRADKVVYSSQLDRVGTARTTLERELDPAAVRKLKADAPADISIGGAGLAAAAFRAGLVDECCLILAPVVVGGGTPAFAPDLRLDLELVDERRFRRGFAYLHYRVRP